MPATLTHAQCRSAMRVLIAVSEAIREAGEIPAGHLYARLMERGCTESQFKGIVATLTMGEPPLVTQRGDLLVWTGPRI